MNGSDFVSGLDNVKETGERQWTARCPAHPDKTPSLSVTEKEDGTLLVHCHAGCMTQEIVAAMGLKMSDLYPEGGSDLGEVVATYDYTDADGELLYQVVRLDPKGFRVRRRARDDDDPKKVRDGWIWSLKYADGTYVNRVLYRLPEITHSKEEHPIMIVEGEKDVDRLVRKGYAATCNLGGAGTSKWREEYSVSLTGADVVVIPDNDDPGRAHAIEVVRSLLPHANSVSVLVLPGEVNGKPVKDASDFFDAGGKEPEFERLWDEAAEGKAWVLEQGGTFAVDELSPGSDDPRPELRADDQDLTRITARTWDVIHNANVEPPRLFRFGGRISRIERDDSGAPFMRTLEENHLRGMLADMVHWLKPVQGGKEFKDALPPLAVVKNLLVTPDPDLPVLTRIVEVPVFARDASLNLKPGYNPNARTFFSPAEGFVIPNFPTEGSGREVMAARDLILEDLLGDFPFVNESEKAHAVAAMMLPFVREMIDGPTPLFLVEKPTPGTGATLLVDVLTYPSLGHSPPTLTEGCTDEEWRKRLTASLLRGPTVLLVDNIRRRMDSAALSSVITSQVWEDRILGLSEIARMPVKCLFIGTGNNPTMSNEIARRTVRIRLDAKVDQPWMRPAEKYRHPDLKGWVRENRGRIVAALLTMVSAWATDGKPEVGSTLGMFESWAKVMGGILGYCGIPGFLSNLQDFYATSDVDANAWRAFVEAWWQQFEGATVTAAQLFDLADESLDLGEGNDRSRKTRLGRKLGVEKDRVYAGLRLLDCGKSHQAAQWKLERLPDDSGRGNVDKPSPDAPRNLPLGKSSPGAGVSSSGKVGNLVSLSTRESSTESRIEAEKEGNSSIWTGDDVPLVPLDRVTTTYSLGDTPGNVGWARSPDLPPRSPSDRDLHVDVTAWTWKKGAYPSADSQAPKPQDEVRGEIAEKSAGRADSRRRPSA